MTVLWRCTSCGIEVAREVGVPPTDACVLNGWLPLETPAQASATDERLSIPTPQGDHEDRAICAVADWGGSIVAWGKPPTALVWMPNQELPLFVDGLRAGYEEMIFARVALRRLTRKTA